MTATYEGHLAPILDLPNELTPLFVAHLSLDDLKRLSLTHRHFLPFTRPLLFARLDLKHGGPVQDCIDWCRSPKGRPSWIRSIKFRNVDGVKFQEHESRLTHEHVSTLVGLTPHLEEIDFNGWQVEPIEECLSTTLASLGRLRSLAFSHIYGPFEEPSFSSAEPGQTGAVRCPRRHRPPQIPVGGTVTALLASLPTGHRLSSLSFGLVSPECVFEIPQRLATDHLAIFLYLINSPARLQRVVSSWPNAESLRALTMDSAALSMPLLRRVAPTLEALTVCGPIEREWLTIPAPRLVVLAGAVRGEREAGDIAFDHDPLATQLFARVHTIIWPSYSRIATPRGLALLPLTLLASLRRVYYRPEDSDVAWQARLPTRIEKVAVEGHRYDRFPDLLKILDEGAEAALKVIPQ